MSSAVVILLLFVQVALAAVWLYWSIQAYRRYRQCREVTGLWSALLVDAMTMAPGWRTALAWRRYDDMRREMQGEG